MLTLLTNLTLGAQYPVIVKVNKSLEVLFFLNQVLI